MNRIRTRYDRMRVAAIIVAATCLMAALPIAIAGGTRGTTNAIVVALMGIMGGFASLESMLLRRIEALERRKPSAREILAEMAEADA